MGRYDFSCEMESSTSQDTYTRYVNVDCYWKNNGWKYHMNGIYGWVTCNGEERCVYENGYPDFQSNNQARYRLGGSSFSYSRGHSSYNVSCSARLESTSSYAPGVRYSGSATYTVDAKTHTLITYNANGGTGAPGNQDKWIGEALWLSGTKPTRTGYNFVRWNTNTSNTGTAFNPGQQYTADPGGTVTLYAIWSVIQYTVSYNANGGTGAPGNQTKNYTSNLTLSSTKPTRAGYIFKGWATSATGSVIYQAGGTYSNNANITLYAIWEIAYKKPTIGNFTASRCNSSGTLSESGTYLKVGFTWTTFNNVQLIKFEYKKQTATTWTAIDIKGSSTGKSGTISVVTGANNILAESSYDIRVWVSDDSAGAADKKTYSGNISIGTIKFPIDVKKGATGVAVGKVAERDNAFDIGYKEIWLGGIKVLWYE